MDTVHRAAPRVGSLLRRARFAGPVAALVVLATGPLRADPAPGAMCLLKGEAGYTVVRVVDGETLVLDDRNEVRLIGALAPHWPVATSEGEDWPPARAARSALERLVLGQSVELAFSGARTDRNGRLLAHMFTTAEGRRIWIQGRLLSEGHARAYALPGQTACLPEMLASERAARASGAGIWKLPLYQIRPASRTDDLLLRAGRFAIVDGLVLDVGKSGERLYLNYGKDWKSDFTASISLRLLRSKPEQLKDIEALSGKRVRVRGWIERRNGPLIELNDPDEIEGPAGESDPHSVVTPAKQ